MVVMLSAIIPMKELRGAAGNSSSESWSTNFTPVSRAICSITLLGKTSEPKMAGNLLYLLDDANDFPRSWLGKVRGLYGRNYFHAIARREVGKGIMIGYQLAVLFRN